MSHHPSIVYNFFTWHSSKTYMHYQSYKTLQRRVQPFYQNCTNIVDQDRSFIVMVTKIKLLKHTSPQKRIGRFYSSIRECFWQGCSSQVIVHKNMTGRAEAACYDIEGVQNWDGYIFYISVIKTLENFS